MRSFRWEVALAMVVFLGCSYTVFADAPSVDLSQGVIVVPGNAGVATKAAELLQDEVFARSGIHLKTKQDLPRSSRPAIVLATLADMPSDLMPPKAKARIPEKADGFAIWVDQATRKAPTVCLVGRDVRGTLFASGRLLRLLDMGKGHISLAPDTCVATAPRYATRGHELGYRGKSNTYDAWDLGRYEQYIRDLVVFGANTIQLIPPVGPTERSSQHMPRPPWEMNSDLAALIASYGLNVWLWLPVEEDITEAGADSAALEERRALFKSCPRIDVVFVPGGDPGDTPPETLLPWVKNMTAVLHEFHPKAEVWLSNEAFSHAWNDYLFNYLEQENPAWLDGMVFGTWTKISLAEERQRTPQRYPIVQYADITHCLRCQYPVPEWDRAFAHTLGREPINPRPTDFARIHNLLAPMSEGFVSYSDGVNDDVNKIVWTALGWNPDADVKDILREYGRYFIGPKYQEQVASGLLGLEENWRGPLLLNQGVKKTLAAWQQLERDGGDALAGNWRFLMGLFRAYYDAYIQSKATAEAQLEQRFCAALARAPEIGFDEAVAAAQALVDGAEGAPRAQELRPRIEEIGGALFKTIGMQLSVEAYGASARERGAVLDSLDVPLSDVPWLQAQAKDIQENYPDSERLARLAAVLDWEVPGPGGFYDDLGNASKQPHLVHQHTFAEDPGFVSSPQAEYSRSGEGPYRLSWLDQAQTLFGAPLRVRYEDLAPEAAYRVRVIYTGRFRPTMRLVADGAHEIHTALPQPRGVPAPLEFDVPQAVTRDGVLELEWQLIGGRGCQVAEVWLLRR